MSPQPSEDEGRISSVLLTRRSPALLMCTFTVGMTGLPSKQLLSDKPDQGNHQAGCPKKNHWDTLAHAPEPTVYARTTGKRRKNLEPTLEQSFWSTPWVRSTIPRFWGYPDLGVGWGRGVTHFMEIDLLEIHHHGNRDLGQEFWICSGKTPIHGIGLADKWFQECQPDFYSKMKIVDSLCSFHCNL